MAEPWPLDYQLAFARQIREKLTSPATTERRQELQHALGRLQTGRFGWCGRCGRELPYWRLVVDPALSLCERCAD